jgi:hypothetical protein
MAHIACPVCLFSTVSGCHKNPLEEQALIAGTKQKLINPVFLDIYGSAQFGTDIYSSF